MRLIFLSFWLMLTHVMFADTTDVRLKTSANCPVIQNLPDTVYTCNTTVQLNPSLASLSGFGTIDTTWTPTNGLSNPNVINPIVTVGSGSQLYKLTVLSLSQTNLVINGDFSNGNSGFTSSYSLGTGGPFGPLSSESLYTIVTNTAFAHTLFTSFGDHTTGSGQMMVVNGASIPNVNIWCQTINVQPNTLYDFSAWLATPYPNNPAILQFSINGSLLVAPFNAPNTLAVWSQFHATWFSGSNTTATICITNQSTALDGNDFALDDIQFREMCSVTDSVYIKPGSVNAFFTSPDTICIEKSIPFAGSQNDPSLNHYWNFGDGITANTLSPTHTYTAAGIYTVTYAISSSPSCIDTFRKQIFVRTPYEVNTTATICDGVSIQFANQTISDSGTYMHIFHTAGGCDSTVYLKVNKGESPNVNFTHSSALNLPVQFTNTSANAIKYLWDFGDSATSNEIHPIHQYKRTDYFKACLTGWSRDGCKAIVCKTVSAEVITAIDVPTAFSPNGDGNNDILYVRGGGIEKLNFKIYNRWGEKIFESNNLLEGWDGTYKGNPVDMEAVAYVLQAFFIDGNNIQKQGNITIIR